MPPSPNALTPYPGPEEQEREFDALGRAAGAELRVYGESVEGRPLRIARLPALLPTGRARVLCVAAIHGVELVASRVALGLLARLARPEGAARAVREAAEVWIAPCLNPDGQARAFRARGEGSLKELRTNARGVDLNRNFPLPPGARPGRFALGGSDDPGSAFYRGGHPCSEPETRCLTRLLDEIPFDASVSLHSRMGTLITPRLPSREDFAAYDPLCRAFAEAQPHHRYPRLASRVFDQFTGELEDYQHHVLGTWATCVEIFPWWAAFRQQPFSRGPLVWRFNPRDPAPWIENDAPGIIAFFLAALERAHPRGRRSIRQPAGGSR